MISENLHRIKEELPPEVKLVAVSKFHPLSSLIEAYSEGQRAFGENRAQEFAAKAVQMPQDVEWHFIGHLQTNKLKLVLPYVSLLESVDSVHLLEAVELWCAAKDRTVDALLELHLGAEETKHGLGEDEVRGILGGAGKYPHVRIRGLMGMATNTADEAVVRGDFARIARLKEALAEEYPDLEGFTELSIGMSHDWRLALDYGATIVRIGTGIFGPRQY